jgi:hypothetical protein
LKTTPFHVRFLAQSRRPSVGGINRGGRLDYLSQSVTGTIAASLASVVAFPALP